jgi:hypothetical protein
MRLLRSFVALCLIANCFSCKKDTTYDTTPTFYFFYGGTADFDKGLILFSSADTVTYQLVISSTFLQSKGTTVTLEVDDSYRQSYNSANGTNYGVMPVQGYTFQSTFATDTTYIYDTIPITFNKQFLLGANYLLPIRIASVTNNYKIDTSSNVVYLHTQDAVLSGQYTSTGSRTLYAGDFSNNVIQSTVPFTIDKNLVPGADSESILDYADLGPNGWQYLLSLSTNNDSLIVEANTVMQNSIQAGSFQVLSSSFDPATKNIYIKTRYKNVSGDDRIVEESLTLQ